MGVLVASIVLFVPLFVTIAILNHREKRRQQKQKHDMLMREIREDKYKITKQGLERLVHILDGIKKGTIDPDNIPGLGD